jgi:GAF domain-containing protein
VLPTPLLSLIVLFLINTVLLLLGTAAAAGFAARFPSGQAKPAPHRLAILAQLLAVAGAIALLVGVFLTNSSRAVSILTAFILGDFGIIALLVVATLIVAYVLGEAEERQRRRWVFLLLGVALAAALVDLISWNTIRSRAIDNVSLLAIGLLPFGLAYVILRHRVIDVGFVLNRAVVYTGVSVIIVAVFVIVETLLGKYVEQTSHAGSVAVQLVVALILGFSVRAIHSRVDRFVDAVLFRERHLAEAAIRFFAQDSSYITDRDVLLSRCVKTIERYAKARGAGIWTAQSPTYRAAASTFESSPVVDENDPALVAMRARRVIVELRDTDSTLPGALAFPMIVRGELLGVLLCGAKADDETYAPDERDALASLASSVGHALDAIEVRELRRRLDELVATHGARPAF